MKMLQIFILNGQSMSKNKDWEEIVAFTPDGKAFTNSPRLLFLYGLENIKSLVTRRVAKFMAACDLGWVWEHYAKSPTLFFAKIEYDGLNQIIVGMKDKEGKVIGDNRRRRRMGDKR